MNMTYIFVLAALGIIPAPAALAQNLSKADYQSQKDTISKENKADKERCKSLSGNAKDICVAEAKGKEKVAKANLEAQYKPSIKNTYDASIAKADANYAIAKEKCDDLAGNPKDVCVKEAKAAQTAAKADAKAQEKSAKASTDANKTSAKAQGKANEKVADARKDAAEDKRDANYAVAKEKCDALAGAAKDRCMADAKAKYGK